MRTTAINAAGQMIAVETITPTRERCVCGWWLNDDNRCVNVRCGELGKVQQDDDNQEDR